MDVKITRHQDETVSVRMTQDELSELFSLGNCGAHSMLSYPETPDAHKERYRNLKREYIRMRHIIDKEPL